MKWALDQIKSALRDKAQRRSVKDLVQSGARSVRVISEENIYKLIQAVVSDTLAGQSEGMGAADRDRIVAQAKERLDQVLKQNTSSEHRSRRQQETILTYQRQVERLERERLALLEKEREAQERVARARSESERTTGALDAAQAELQQAQAERDEALAALAAARETGERRNTEASDRALSALRSELGDLKLALSSLSEQQPHGLDQSQLDEVITRLSAHEAGATRELEERFARSMDHVLDQVGRTLRAATAGPIDRPVEATEMLLTKVFERESEMDSNIRDLGVAQRNSERGIDRSLERLRAARKGRGGGAGGDSGSAEAAPPGEAPTTKHASGSNGASAKRKSRRKGPAERRRSGAKRPSATERRKSARDRRKS
jgi:chromosome segregation ATPase